MSTQKAKNMNIIISFFINNKYYLIFDEWKQVSKKKKYHVYSILCSVKSQ